MTVPDVNVAASPGDQEGPVDPELGAFRQGDVIREVTELIVVGEDGAAETVAAPYGTVLISQTCDIVRPDRPTAQLSPIVLLENGDMAREARAGKRPRYVPLAEMGDEYFADLSFISTVRKKCLAGKSHSPGVGGGLGVSRFGRGVARKFGRFAFPDELTPWLKPLEDVVASKSAKANSPEGVALSSVVEFRLESATDWQQFPLNLTLSIILDSGALPTFASDSTLGISAPLFEWLYDKDNQLQRGAAEIASRLYNCTDPEEKYFCWMALGEAWVLKCRPPGSVGSEIQHAVASISADVACEDEYTLAQYRRSEQLDLDHLSEPLR